MRQDELRIERKFGTHDWSQRVNLSLFSMCVIDAYLLYKSASCVNITPNGFFWRLATEMIDQPTTRGRRATTQGTATPARSNGTSKRSPPSGVGLHMTPTKVMVPYKRRAFNGKFITYNGKSVMSQRRDQQRCVMCSTKTTWTCSHCTTGKGNCVYFCHTKEAKNCWLAHINSAHETYSEPVVDPENLFQA